MKKFIFVLLIALSPLSFAEIAECGSSDIDTISTGKAHGAMVKLTPNCGWVCLDPDSEYMSEGAHNAAFALLLTRYAQGQQVKVWMDTEFKPVACGGAYPVLFELR